MVTAKCPNACRPFSKHPIVSFISVASSCINTGADGSLNRSHDCLLKIHVLEGRFTPRRRYVNWLDKKSHVNNGGDCADGCWCVWRHWGDIWEEDEDGMTTANWPVLETRALYMMGVSVLDTVIFNAGRRIDLMWPFRMTPAWNIHDYLDILLLAAGGVPKKGPPVCAC